LKLTNLLYILVEAPNIQHCTFGQCSCPKKEDLPGALHTSANIAAVSLRALILAAQAGHSDYHTGAAEMIRFQPSGRIARGKDLRAINRRLYADPDLWLTKG
jgi:hypothetical protein